MHGGCSVPLLWSTHVRLTFSYWHQTCLVFETRVLVRTLDLKIPDNLASNFAPFGGRTRNSTFMTHYLNFDCIGNKTNINKNSFDCKLPSLGRSPRHILRQHATTFDQAREAWNILELASRWPMATSATKNCAQLVWSTSLAKHGTNYASCPAQCRACQRKIHGNFDGTG